MGSGGRRSGPRLAPSRARSPPPARRRAPPPLPPPPRPGACPRRGTAPGQSRDLLGQRLMEAGQEVFARDPAREERDGLGLGEDGAARRVIGGAGGAGGGRGPPVPPQA